jgi:tetratricopeptide (TPR) repeat protein
MLKFPYIFTFYSFKGGVGRSLALLNVAYTLAGRGRHVLVVDMDLEAPGISSFLLGQKELAVPKTAHPLDVVALLSEAIAAVKTGGVPKDVASNLPPISNYIRSVADEKLAPLRPKMGQLGRLDFVVADRDHDYWRRWAEVGIQGLPQDQLVALSSVLHHYFKAQRFAHRPLGLEPFEPALPTPYDYVLVDSRTGITELGGLCVGPLADRLIVVTGLNDQNVQGTLSFMEEAGIAPRPRAKEEQQWDEADARSTDKPEVLRLGPKPTLVVASPVPSGEIDFKRARLDELKRRLGIRPIPLSYHPQMALLESVFVRDYPEEYLALEYGTLTDRIMARVSDHPVQLAQRSGALWSEKKAYADAIACVIRLTPHQPELGIPLLRQLGDRLESSSDEEFWAERQLHALLSQDAEMKPVALSNWGNALLAQARTKQSEAADRLFEAACQKFAEALKLKPDFHEALSNWGSTLLAQAKTKQGEAADRLFEAAYQKYAEALKLKPDFHEALNNWGSALWSHSRLKTGAARPQLRRAARGKLLAAERIRPGSGAYNLACFEAGESNIAEAIHWLKQDAATGSQASKKQLTEDTDFDPIRKAPEFAEFLRSLPEA